MGQGSCAGCGGSRIQVFLDLGEQPHSDGFPTVGEADDSEFTRVQAGICRDCHLVQLVGDTRTAKETQLGVQSASSRRYAELTVPRLVGLLDLPPGPRYLERHSPHGDGWRAQLEQAGLRPATAAADLVVDLYGAMHRADFATALDELVADVADSGYLVMETQYWLTTMLNGHFDTIRSGHPVYVTLSALAPMLEERGLGVISAAKNSLHGDGLQIVARRGAGIGQSAVGLLAEERKAGLQDWPFDCDLQLQADEAAAALREFLVDARQQGRRVFGYGAPTRSIVLLNYAGITADLLPATADMSVVKQGRILPGTGIRIISPEDLRREGPDDILILTYDIADEVRGQFAELDSTTFWIPLPKPAIV